MANVETRILVATSLVALSLAARPSWARDLFREAPEGKAALGSAGPEVVRSRVVEVDFDALLDDDGAFAASPVSELRLNLFDDATLIASRDENATDLADHFAWAGRLDGGGQVVLVASGGLLAGSVNTLAETYRIRPAGPGGLHVIEHVDLAQLPDEAEPIPVDEAALPFAAGPVQKAVAKDDGSVIDLLVVYTPAARGLGVIQGGIESLIRLGVTEANVALAQSGIGTRFRLVHLTEVSYQEDPGSSIQSHLSRLATKGDGELDQVHTLREQYKADLVQLIGASTEGGCGVGYLMRGTNNTSFERLAFSYTATRCISPGYTMAHELGHNLGSNHAIGDPVGQGAFPYSYGYKDIDHGFRTVMAYPCEGFSCPRVLHFSNPAVTFEGHPTGTDIQNNARSIDSIRVVAANFRTGAAGGANACKPKLSTFVGCKGGGCKVCAEKIAGYDAYLANHPGCIVHTKCRGTGYAKCSVTCPAPTAADR